MYFLVSLCLVLFVGFSCCNSCVPDPFGNTQKFNLFSLSTFSGCNSDVEGRAAANGDVNLSSYSLGLLLSQSQNYTLTSSGNVNWVRGSSWHGGITGATVSLQEVGIMVSGQIFNSECCSDSNCGHCTPGATSSFPFDFISAELYLKELSQYWSNLESNTASNEHIHTITLNCIEGPNTFNVFNGIFAGTHITSIHIQCDATQTVLINYSPEQVTLQNLGFTLYNTDQSKIIHHFTGDTLTVSGVGVPGTIFAPWSDVTVNGAVVYGAVYAGSFGDNDNCNDGQINSVPFTGCCPVPPPAHLCCNYSKQYIPGGQIFQNSFCTPEPTCENIEGWVLEYASNVEDCSACCVCA